MKLSTRLAMIVLCSALGLVLIGGVALYGIRSTMMAERESQTRTLLALTTGILEYFHDQEQSGKLSHDDARARASEALQGLKHGSDYVFARNDSNILVSHPDASRVGKLDMGSTLPDGRTTVQAYKDALAVSDPGFVTIQTSKPGGDKSLQFPKLNGVTRYAPWGWTIGTGFFVDDIERAFRGYALTLLVTAAIILAISVSLAVVLSRRIYSQLGGEPADAMAAANEIAAGRLNRAITSAPGGSLMDALGRMQGNLKDMIAAIKHGADALNTAAADIAGKMHEIRQASEHSSEATSATAAAIEELTVSVGQIADSARETEGNSGRSAELAQSGEQRVNAASSAIQDISQQIGDASQRIGELSERSRQIGGIAATIQEIAEQTNLLALNAAIEAARAGEQGRGFAVVADEVRKLAERTTKATSEIAQTISAVRADTEAVVERMQSVRPQVDRGVSLAGEAAEALRGINQGAQETLAKIREVAHATAEQTVAANSIASNVERIAHMVEESDMSVRNAGETARTLASLANELNGTAARFHV